MKNLLAILPLAIQLCACATKSQPPPQCEELFVILPDNFIIDLAAGSEVWLDPAVQDFTLFCSPTEAQDALAGTPSLPGEWRVYKVEGDSKEIARPGEGGGYILARQTRAVDWVQVN